MPIQYIAYTGAVRTVCQPKMNRWLAPYRTIQYGTVQYIFVLLHTCHIKCHCARINSEIEVLLWSNGGIFADSAGRRERGRGRFKERERARDRERAKYK